MAIIEEGVLEFYFNGNYYQRIGEAKTPEELKIIYDELNKHWKKNKKLVSVDIIKLFLNNKKISKDLFKEILFDFLFKRNGGIAKTIEFLKKVYQNLDQYESIEFSDLKTFANYNRELLGKFCDYIINNSNKISELSLIVRTTRGFKANEIKDFWEKRNQILDNNEKKSFIKQLLEEANVSKDILLQAFEEFKDDIEIVIIIFKSGIEDFEISSKVLETFTIQDILSNVMSNIDPNEMSGAPNLDYVPHLREIEFISRIAEDHTLKRILNKILNGTYVFHYSYRSLFAPKDETETLGQPKIIEDTNYIKIMLNIAKNPNVSIDTLKVIVQSTNDIETLYYCIVNSDRHPEIFKLIMNKKISYTREELEHNELLADFDEEMKVIKAIYEPKIGSCGEKTLKEYLIEGYIGRKELRPGATLFNIKEEVYDIMVASSNEKKYGNNVGELMDKIREELKFLSFEGISSGAYRPDNFQDIQSKENAYFECLVNYKLVAKQEDIRKFLVTCLGEKYLKRLDRDIALFEKRGLDLFKTASKGTLQRGF